MMARSMWLLAERFLQLTFCSSTVCTAGVHSSASHEPTNALIDFPCTHSHTLATQPIRDSLYCRQKISSRSKGPSYCTASQRCSRGGCFVTVPNTRGRLSRVHSSWFPDYSLQPRRHGGYGRRAHKREDGAYLQEEETKRIRKNHPPQADVYPPSDRSNLCPL